MKAQFLQVLTVPIGPTRSYSKCNLPSNIIKQAKHGILIKPIDRDPDSKDATPNFILFFNMDSDIFMFLF